jgi:hypothetical protein
VTPPGTVQLTREEHDRLQGEARTAKARAKKLEDAQADRERDERIEAQRAAGEFDTALGEERKEKDRLRQELEQRDVRDAVRDHISGLGLSGSKAAGLLRLVDLSTIDVGDSGAPDPTAVEAVVAATIGQYPDLFNLESAQQPPNKEGRMKRTPGPAAPPSASHDATPSDYLSPEEYTNTPHKIRMTPEFQERARKSRPHWPTVLPANTFAIGEG